MKHPAAQPDSGIAGARQTAAMEGIATSRLILVPFTLPLLEAAAANRREQLTEMLQARLPNSWPSPGVREYQLPDQIGRLQSDPAQLPWLGRLILHREPAQVVGCINLKGPPDRGRVEIGYEIEPEFRRQGYATEAARALIDWCTGKGVREIHARVLPENAVSVHMLRRLGFEPREAIQDPRLGTMHVLVLRTTASVRPSSPSG